MGAASQARTAPLVVAATHDGDELVYYEGESPGWRAANSLGEHHAPAHACTRVSTGYMPLTLMRHTASPGALYEVHRRVSQLARFDLIRRYRRAFTDGKRLIAGIMATELIERGIPPCFWHDMLALDDATLDQRADLVLTDLAWLRRRYPDHAGTVRYRRGKALLTGSDVVFRREVEFAFYEGRCPAWKLVGSMSMTERQQWNSAYLRSTPVKRHAEDTEALSAGVDQALAEDLQAVCRTTAFTDADAAASLARRYALWRCALMVKDASPTEISERYQQMTGMMITRQVAAKQLAKVRAVLKAKRDDLRV